MKRKRPPLISRIFFSKPVLWFMGYLIRFAMMLLYMTLRVRFAGTSALKTASHGRLILSLWHDQLALAPLIRRILPKHPLAIVVSKSRDGRLLAAFINTFRHTQPISVAHNMRYKALLEMVEAIEHGKIVIITPDGPRGPRHVVKPGLTYCKEKASAQVITMKWQASRAWQLNTWDKMQIPKPFAKVTVDFEVQDGS